MPGEYGLILFKALGICLITQLASDACRDAGEAALASKEMCIRDSTEREWKPVNSTAAEPPMGTAL